jgi:predicted nucleotidyltransferase
MRAMSLDEPIAILRNHEPELKAARVASVSLFVSTARGEAKAANEYEDRLCPRLD